MKSQKVITFNFSKISPVILSFNIILPNSEILSLNYLWKRPIRESVKRLLDRVFSKLKIVKIFVVKVDLNLQKFNRRFNIWFTSTILFKVNFNFSTWNNFNSIILKSWISKTSIKLDFINLIPRLTKRI